MLRIAPHRLSTSLPLHGLDATRRIEAVTMPTLPPHALMERAASAVFRWGRALYPHAQTIWLACGPGNNGGDGLWAAALWQQHLRNTTRQGQVSVTWTGDDNRLPEDARHALHLARQAGVQFVPTPPEDTELMVDALLGIGASPSAAERQAPGITLLRHTTLPVLNIDLPSGLHPDTGCWLTQNTSPPRGPRHTLSLLTLKPGLFTAQGRDAAGDIWWDDLGCLPNLNSAAADALLFAPTTPPLARQKQHSAHKGTHGDVLVLGGQDVRFNGQGMTGAALLAARSALHAGAGRVLVGLLGTHDPAFTVDALQPDLMFREVSTLCQPDTLKRATVVCGCGGGLAVADWLPEVLAHSARLVLDADALNAIAASVALQNALRQRQEQGLPTVITPHPLEAARLQGLHGANGIQSHRLHAAQALAQRYGCMVVLKGSGTVVAAPEQVPCINPTGNSLLACAGTGDVLAGMLGAYWANQRTTQEPLMGARSAATQAVFRHGLLADQWPRQQALTASALSQSVTPC